MLQRLIGEDIHLAWHPAPDLWLIKADPSQIDQILANLCVNARDAIKNTGQVTIKTRNNTFNADFCQNHPDSLPGEYIHLSVSDDGSGMDQETMSHVFEPFFTSKGLGEGTGLGLATVYGIVKQPTRRLSVEHVMRELTQLRGRFPGNYMLLFHDEIFTENRDWVIKLCAELKRFKLGVPFWCFTRPDLIDLELCHIMRGSGFVGLSMGMESASDRILRILGKELNVSQIEKGFRAAQKAGLLTTGSVMIGTASDELGQPDEDRRELESTVRMVARLHPDVLTVTLTTPLPGTPLYESMKDRILAKSPEEFNYYHIWPGKYPLRLQKLTAEDLAKTVARIRGAWKRKLWKTALRISILALSNGAFRNTLCNQIAKVMKRKILPA